MNPRNDDNDETRFIGRQEEPQRPRQYFPGENGPSYETRDQQPYQEPRYEAPQHRPPGYDPAAYAEPEPEPGKGGRAPMLLGILLGLAAIAAVVFFLLWRSAAGEAEQEPPPPVTETQTATQTVTQTATGTVTEESGPLDNLPTELPSELPSELPEFDIDGFLDQFRGGEAPAGEPAPAQ
ncbi:hypothetical protein [Corynebacterium halotolerans]|uniref:Uncharacterized protein n=1 Tax=Corynebacterium halotolerans YIM 70093 = DSM 44683 TaxID=1121362 RepID=M1MUS5_9CORY|nr:hypothetical protein [Corynebacterium halotolerans]AGF71474.1 hypothetical protein A605_02300 [Corynebacterium halotolerans YIM 70093 = DSM 44683]